MLKVRFLSKNLFGLLYGDLEAICNEPRFFIAFSPTCWILFYYNLLIDSFIIGLWVLSVLGLLFNVWDAIMLFERILSPRNFLFGFYYGVL